MKRNVLVISAVCFCCVLLFGIYLIALTHRYKSVGGIAVMDTWTETLLVPDSTGKYKPCPNPYLK